MVSRETSLLSRSVRVEWATDRWLFALIFSAGVVCGGSVLTGGIIVIASRPPPTSVWLLAVVCVLIEMRCRKVKDMSSDELDPMGAHWDFEQT